MYCHHSLCGPPGTYHSSRWEGQPHATLPVRQQNSEQDERESTRISYLSLTIPLNVYDSESFSTANWSSKFLISLI